MAPLTLKNLAFIAVAAKLWDTHKFEEIPRPSDFHQTAIDLCRQVETFELPRVLLLTLRMVILDFGKKKTAWVRMVTMHLNRPLKYTDKIHWNGCGIIDTVQIEGQNWTEYDWSGSHHIVDTLLGEEYILYFPISGMFLDFIEEAIYYEDPTAVDRFLPGKENKLHFVRFLQALIAGNSADVSTHWPVVNFADTLGNTLEYALRKAYEIERSRVTLFDRKTEMWFSQRNYNDTMAWFVFEVLNESQRGEFFKLGQSKLIRDRLFLNMFANVFCHWPWHDEAIKYFTAKDKLNREDRLVLNEVLDALRGQDFVPSNDAVTTSLFDKVQKIKDKFEKAEDRLKKKPLNE